VSGHYNGKLTETFSESEPDKHLFATCDDSMAISFLNWTVLCLSVSGICALP